ncbi:hypothetical protein [Streptococcus ruminantium]|nr:hypothetical protein [Streptococcus ruminantium]
MTENGYNDKIKSSSWLILFLKKNETFQKKRATSFLKQNKLKRFKKEVYL